MGPAASGLGRKTSVLKFDPDSNGPRPWGRGHALEGTKAGLGRVTGGAERRDSRKPRSVGVDLGVISGLDLIGLNPSTQSSHRPSLTPATGSRLSPNARGVAVTPPPPALQDSCGTRRSGLSSAPPPPPPRVGIAGRLSCAHWGAGSLSVPHPKPLPPPAGQGQCSPGAAEPRSSPAPRNWDPWKERVKRKKVREELGAGRSGRRRSATPHPRPRPRGLLPPPAGGTWGQVGAPGPGRAGSGVGGSCQCGGRGRGASGPRGRLLITRPPSPGSRSHGQPGAPARRGRRRPGREVGPCRARVAVQWGGGAGGAPLPPPREHLSPGWGWWAGRGVALAPGGATGRGGGGGPGSRHLRLSVAFYSRPPHPLPGAG